MKTYRPLVFLNGNRPYVQGSQMLGRAAEIVASTHSIDANLHSAAFHALTDRCVTIELGEGLESNARSLGSANFLIPDGSTLCANFFPSDEVAKRGEVAPSSQVQYMPGHIQERLCGSWNITGAAGFEDVLTSIIQAIKSLHEELGPDIRDIWFTGLRSAALPVGPHLPANFCLESRLLRESRTGPVCQTMQRVTLLAPKMVKPLMMAASFSYRTLENADAA